MTTTKAITRIYNQGFFLAAAVCATASMADMVHGQPIMWLDFNMARCSVCQGH
jgi:hypothetical protein